MESRDSTLSSASSISIEHPLKISTNNTQKTHISPTTTTTTTTTTTNHRISSTTSGGGSNSSTPQRRVRRKSRRGTAEFIHASNKTLPRSVRWRLSLGLLTRPTIEAANNTSSSDSSSRDSKEEALYKSIEELNALKIRCQRSRYDELEKKHYWKSTPVGIATDEASINNETQHQQQQQQHSEERNNNLHHVAYGDDPLSALLQRKNSNVTTSNGKIDDKKQGLFGGNGIFGMKKQPRDRTKSTETTSSNNDNNTSLQLSKSEDNNTNNESSAKEESACKGSRWAEFYSTREVLDVIEKDLDRLPNDHYTIYHEYRLKMQQRRIQREELERNGGIKSQQNSKAVLKREQSWKIGRSGIKKKVNSAENFSDLLQSMLHGEDEEELRKQQNKEEEIQISIKERANKISQLLFVYARDHSEIGYRQGMHEVLSYILLALEMDLLDQQKSIERRQQRRNSGSFGLPSKEKNEGSMAGVDSSGNIVIVNLVDADYILHDAYNLFECIMTSLAPAYDVIPETGDDDAVQAAILGESDTALGDSPMEMMTSSIISKIRFIARDEQLFGHVLYMPVPPTLYFAKWVRLLFGREVAGGMKSVMSLWDAFFDLASARTTTSHEDVPIPIALLDVLKAAAAGMILLIRDKLLAPTMAYDGTMTGDPDPNNGIGYLMNYPPIQDIRPLVELISDLLSKEKKLSKQYQVSRERKLDKQYLPTESYTSVQLNGTEQRPALSSSVFQENIQVIDDQQPYNDIAQETTGEDNELPRVYRTGQTPRKQHHDHVAESIEQVGHIAGEILDFGAKTASAAIASIQKQYENHKHAATAAIDHPLQDSSEPAGHSSDEYIITYRADAAHLSEKGSIIKSAEQSLNSSVCSDNNKSEQRDLVDELFSQEGKDGFDPQTVSIENFNDLVISSDRLNDSVPSKLSEAKVIGDSILKSPKELANMLEKSVNVLMKHFNERLNTDADDNSTSASAGGQSLSNTAAQTSTVVPDDIWGSLADIDRVRKELMQQDAITALDHARLCSSFRSGVSNGSSGRGSRGTPTTDEAAEQLRKLGVKHTTPSRSGQRRGSNF